MQLNSMDPDGQNFRYPLRTNGNLALPEQSRFDLEIIRRRMEELHNYLSGIDGWLDDNNRLVLEYIAEMDREMNNYGSAF